RRPKVIGNCVDRERRLIEEARRMSWTFKDIDKIYGTPGTVPHVPGPEPFHPPGTFVSPDFGAPLPPPSVIEPGPTPIPPTIPPAKNGDQVPPVIKPPIPELKDIPVPKPPKDPPDSSSEPPKALDPASGPILPGGLTEPGPVIVMPGESKPSRELSSPQAGRLWTAAPTSGPLVATETASGHGRSSTDGPAPPVCCRPRLRGHAGRRVRQHADLQAGRRRQGPCPDRGCETGLGRSAGAECRRPAPARTLPEVRRVHYESGPGGADREARRGVATGRGLEQQDHLRPGPDTRRRAGPRAARAALRLRPGPEVPAPAGRRAHHWPVGQQPGG